MNNELLDNQQYDDNNIIDEENDFGYQYGDDKCNQFGQFEEYEQENNIQDENNRDNKIFLMEQENINLKNKIEELNQLLFQKNKELEETKIKNDNHIIKINKTFDKHINEYQRLVQNYKYIQNELNKAKIEIQNKNQIINDLQNNMNINNNSTQEPNIIMILNQNLKNIYQNFFQERNNLFNENEYINKDINMQMQILISNINIFSQKLINYKNNNLKNNSKSNNNLNPQFYLRFIEIMNNFCNNLPQNIYHLNNLPKYTLKDNNDKIYKNILITIKILTDYIISFLNNKNDISLSYNSSIYTNNKYNDELNRRLKEMSELLIKSNEYLNKSRQENNELKHRYKELEKKHNLTIKDISTIDNINKDKDLDKLISELNKKNQQIKSLEHMLARFTRKRNNNSNNIINLTSKSMLNDSSYYGKIINKKIYNEIKNNQNKTSFYLTDNKFIKDEKNENNLKNFLDKYTNGEYGNTAKINENNNKAVFNIKDEIENLNNEISDDEIENEHTYNEEEEERKYQMEGKINI